MSIRQRSYSIMLGCFALGACDIGGANSGQQGPGTPDDGVDLAGGEIAVHPNGDSFIARFEDGTVHGRLDGQWRGLDLEYPDRLAFAPSRDVIYVVSDDDGGSLVAYDVGRDQRLWSVFSEIIDGSGSWLSDSADQPWLKVTADDAHVIVAGDDQIEVHRTADGERVGRWAAFDQLVDLDVSADGQHAYAVVQGPEFDQTEFFVLDLPNLQRKAISVPNCPAELVIEPAGKFGFMAPTTCSADPVSVIDLSNGEFVRNLPGFGPVALAGHGELGVAFMDLENLDERLFMEGDPRPDGDRRYHLMLIDTRTLEFQTFELGDTLPRYAATPDGKLLLLDSSAWHEDERIRLFDVRAKTFETVLGPDIPLDNFVITPDSSRAFVVDAGVYELDFAAAVLSSLPLPVVPTNINITPAGDVLLMRELLGPVHVYELASRQIVRSVGPGGDADECPQCG